MHSFLEHLYAICSSLIMLMMMLMKQMKSIKVSIMLITLFCIWNLSNPLFTSIDVVKVMSGVVWMNDVVMNDQMELMNDQLVMSEWVSGMEYEWRSG